MISLQTFCVAVIAAEIFFYILYRLYLLPESNKRVLTPPYPLGPRSSFVLRIFRRLSDSSSSLKTKNSIQDFIRGWFFDIPFSRIKKDNLVEFLTWAMYSKHTEELEREERKEIEIVFEYVDERHGITFSDGYDKDVKCARLNLEPVEPIHR